jgi:hypothetical protein
MCAERLWLSQMKSVLLYLLWMCPTTDDIIALTVDQFFPLSQGLVQFDPGKGLSELHGRHCGRKSDRLTVHECNLAAYQRAPKRLRTFP